MIYTDFKGKQLSQLGFGTMRLPLKEDKTIDEAATLEMITYGIEHGINYFDTAYPYHGGESERVIGKLLKNFPRDSYYLATKYPGHQLSKTYDPAAIFEEQLKKCDVDYFDFYLLHNVQESSIKTYMDPQWGILDYFKEQKRLGRIKHLGFSCHGQVENLKEFLDYCGDAMEFCQIQLNYLDWTLQRGREKCELLARYNIPVWIMEPVRGGKLAKLSEENEAKLKQLRPEASIPSWAFRFLQDIPTVTMILSGMSNMEQVKDNIDTFSDTQPLTIEETALLLEIADELKSAVPCTTCRYCCDGCPMGLNIPLLLHTYNDIRYSPGVNAAMRLEGLPADKQASACIKCGKCTKSCPQGIPIPQILEELTKELAKLPRWADICRQREEASQKEEHESDQSK